LDGERLGEDLRQLMLCGGGSYCILLIIINDMRSLGKLASKVDVDRSTDGCTLALIL
jgi:hypothetical protein